ncbi:ArsR/SmtB family transcription factor [Micrococcus sp.]|uniref:ArsR/SmtB family transcription factor n=1 Tax=Micrococcus sp. TaxID=1271 RepID=UPI0039C65EA8
MAQTDDDVAPSPASPAHTCAPDTHAQQLMPAERAAGLAAVFKALADPTRVRLLALITAAPQGTACACHLPEALGISQPTLSHHLKRLVEAGMLAREQRGRWAHYTARPVALAAARSFLLEEAVPPPHPCGHLPGHLHHGHTAGHLHHGHGPEGVRLGHRPGV